MRRLTLVVAAAIVARPLLAAGESRGELGGARHALRRPLRLPILPARSIQDGPARWYLKEASPQAPLPFCEAFGDVPNNISDILWKKEGIRSLAPEQMARIRKEVWIGMEEEGIPLWSGPLGPDMVRRRF